MISLNHLQVESVLPHRSPILLIDTVSELEPGVSAKAQTFIEPSWDIFRGHFPSAPVLPGVYIIEAMAQASDLLLLTIPGNENKTPFFLSVSRARFLRQVKPGETIYISAELSCDAGGGMYDCSAVISAGGKRVAAGTISIALR